MGPFILIFTHPTLTPLCLSDLFLSRPKSWLLPCLTAFFFFFALDIVHSCNWYVCMPDSECCGLPGPTFTVAKCCVIIVCAYASEWTMQERTGRHCLSVCKRRKIFQSFFVSVTRRRKKVNFYEILCTLFSQQSFELYCEFLLVFTFPSPSFPPSLSPT